MTYANAIKKLINGKIQREERSECIGVVCDAVMGYCKTDIAPEGETSLHDWLTAGEFTEMQDPADIAQEWDELAEESSFILFSI
jgi:hypothetical protein